MPKMWVATNLVPRAFPLEIGRGPENEVVEMFLSISIKCIVWALVLLRERVWKLISDRSHVWITVWPLMLQEKPNAPRISQKA